LTAFSGSLYAACFFPAIIFGLHWTKGSGTSVMTSFVVGIVVLLTWDLVPGSQIVHEVFPSMLLSTLVFWGVSHATKDGADDKVRALLEGAAARSAR